MTTGSISGMDLKKKKDFMTPLLFLNPLEGFALMNNILYVKCLCDFSQSDNLASA